MTEQIKEEKDITPVNPLVFISHDTRDAQLAEAFSELLRNISAGVLKSFRSSDKKGTQGIEYGTEWYPNIIKNIQKASDVVCLLTQNSVNRPWILFEAGMAKGKLNTSISGVALGIPLQDASTGPFAQFQNCGDDEESLTKLVLQLINKIPNSDPNEQIVKSAVTTFRDTITKILKTQPKEEQKPIKNDLANKYNSSAKLFEEIKVMFQDLHTRITETIPMDKKIRRTRRLHPMMIEELLHMSKNNTLGFMIVLSLFKDSMPWIYDIGIETIKNIKSSKTQKAKEKAVSEFEELIDISMHHPMIHEFYMDSKEDYILFREMPRILMKNLHRFMIEE